MFYPVSIRSLVAAYPETLTSGGRVNSLFRLAAASRVSLVRGALNQRSTGIFLSQPSQKRSVGTKTSALSRLTTVLRLGLLLRRYAVWPASNLND